MRLMGSPHFLFRGLSSLSSQSHQCLSSSASPYFGRWVAQPLPRLTSHAAHNFSQKHSPPPSGSGDKSGSTDDHQEINEHFKLDKNRHPLFGQSSYWDNPVPHPIYSPKELESVKPSHKEPIAMYDKVALFAVKCMRTGFDIVSRYKGPGGEMTKRSWINRCLFLETVAGCVTINGKVSISKVSSLMIITVNFRY